MKHVMRSIAGALLVLLVLAAAIAAYLWSGGYNIAADDPHTKPLYTLLSTVRERSIEVRSRDIKVPDLNSPQMIANGAREYAAMCMSCHLAPGVNDSDIRPGLNPKPPDFTEHAPHDPAEAFWVIKHGIKMTGMPAWGVNHDDETLWSMVALLKKLPDMTEQQYALLVGNAASDPHIGSAGLHQGSDHVSGHSHNQPHSHGKPSH